MEHLTTITKAQRTLENFTLDALSKEHRVTNEELELDPSDYREIWERIFNSSPRPYRLDVKEMDEDQEDSISLFYSANNHKYTLKILKATVAQAA
ncbi:MAG: hypothetical protein AAFY76_01860 [Cyanobacteria bacterium J06649_11]